MLLRPYSSSPGRRERLTRFGWGLLVVLGGGLGLLGLWIVQDLPGRQAPPPTVPVASPAHLGDWLRPLPETALPRDVAARYLAAWSAGDYEAMHALLSPAAAARVSAAEFRRRHTAIADEAMIVRLIAEPLGGAGAGDARQPFQLRAESARVGWFTDQNVLRLSRTDDRWGVDWQPTQIVAALQPGDRVVMEDEWPARGRIFDRHGHLLAQQTEMATIGLVPAALVDQEATISKVSAVLGLDAAAVRRQVTASEPTWFVPLAVRPWRKPSLAERALLDLPGMEARVRLERHYPLSSVAAHVLGYVRRYEDGEVAAARTRGLRPGDWVGAAGVEALAEDWLAGRPGGRLLVVAPDGTVRAVLAERRATAARDVYLTIDLPLQRAAEAALGDRPGGVVALDPASGAIRALVSRPAIDPNLFVTDPAAAQALARDERRRPLLNRASGVAYPPGEPFGLVAAAAGIAVLGLPADAVIDCPASVPGATSGERWSNRQPARTGPVTIAQALTSGCATAFQTLADEARRTDPTTLPAIARRLGFGGPTGVLGLDDGAGRLPPAADGVWNQADTVAAAAGQGTVEVTALQMARAYAAAVAGGSLWRPRLIERVTDAPPTGQGAPSDRLDASVATALQSIVLSRSRRSDIAPVTHASHDSRDDLLLAAGGGPTVSSSLAPAWAVAVPPPSTGVVLVVVIEHGDRGAAAVAPLARQAVDRAVAR